MTSKSHFFSYKKHVIQLLTKNSTTQFSFIKQELRNSPSHFFLLAHFYLDSLPTVYLLDILTSP